jgi:hypothetical protein
MAKRNQEDDILDTMEQAAEVLNFDPFSKEAAGEGGEPAAAEPESAPVAAEPAPVEPPQEPVAVPAPPEGQASDPTPPPPAVTPPPAAPEPTLRDVMSLVMQQNQRIEQLASPARPTEPASAAPGPPAGAPGAPGVPPYMFDVPDQLIEGLRSEDPATVKSAYAHLLSGAAQAIHQNMYSNLTESLTPIINQRLTETQTTFTKRQAMSAEWGTSEWSAPMRDEIYRRVVATLQTLQGYVGTPPAAAAQVPASGAPGGAPTPAVLGNVPGVQAPAGGPPLILDPGVRPATPSRGVSTADQIEELLF